MNLVYQRQKLSSIKLMKLNFKSNLNDPKKSTLTLKGLLLTMLCVSCVSVTSCSSVEPPPPPPSARACSWVTKLTPQETDSFETMAWALKHNMKYDEFVAGKPPVTYEALKKRN